MAEWHIHRWWSSLLRWEWVAGRELWRDKEVWTVSVCIHGWAWQLIVTRTRRLKAREKSEED